MSRQETSCPVKMHVKIQTSKIGPIIRSKREVPDSIKTTIFGLQKTMQKVDENLETVEMMLRKVYAVKITTETMKIIECQRKTLQSLEVSLRNTDNTAKVLPTLLKMEKLTPFEDDLKKLVHTIDRAKETKKKLDDLYREIKYRKTSHVVDKHSSGVSQNQEKAVTTPETLKTSKIVAKPKEPAAPQKTTPAKETRRTATDPGVDECDAKPKNLASPQKPTPAKDALRTSTDPSVVKCETLKTLSTPTKTSKIAAKPKQSAAPQKSTPAKETRQTSTDVGGDMCDAKKLRACQKKLIEMEEMRKEWQEKAQDLEYEKAILEKKFKELEEFTTSEIETLKSELEKKENRIQDLHYELKNDQNKRDILMERITKAHEKKILELEKNAVNSSEIAKFKNEAKNIEISKNLEIETLKLAFEKNISANEKEKETFKMNLEKVRKKLTDKEEEIEKLTEKLEEEVKRFRLEEEGKNTEIETLKLELTDEKVEKNKMLIEQQINFDKEKEDLKTTKNEVDEELLRLQFENSVLEKELEHQRKVQLTVTDENNSLWYRNVHLREKNREVQSKLNTLSMRTPNINPVLFDTKPVNYPPRFSSPVWSPYY